MAEELTPAAPSGGGRRVIIVATVFTVVFFTIFLVGLRSCSSTSSDPSQIKAAPVQKLSADVIIYNNLSLKDAAAVIVRLKDLKIPYKTLNDGTAVSVPRARADEARLGLAEKNLPSGGSVGWEIFDQAKLGATDSDRRIQFIRAMSGELSRTINQISAIEDSRVQIVMPQAQMFETNVAPVTASVLLKMRSGESLSQGQVSAIVYLFVNSIEKLQPENVIIIDTNGNILSSGNIKPIVKAPVVSQLTPSIREQVQQQTPLQVVIERPEERAALEVQAKMDLEDRLTSKVQSILNRVYPPNTATAKISVDSIRNQKKSVLILIDREYNAPSDLKKATYDTVAAAIGYDRKKGDIITIKLVGMAGSSVSKKQKYEYVGSQMSAAGVRSIIKKVYRKYGNLAAGGVFVVAGLIIIVIFRMLFGKRKPEEATKDNADNEEAAESSEETTQKNVESPTEVPVVEQIIKLAVQKPEQAAKLISNWMAEDNG